MVTVPEIVEKIVYSSPFLESALAKDIINLSGLAREIKSEVQAELMKEVQEGAIVMALKRMKPRVIANNIRVETLLKNVEDISVKSSLIACTYNNSETLITAFKSLLEKVDSRQNKFMTFTQGTFETTLIINNGLRDIVESAFKKERNKVIIENLSSITLKLPPENVEVPGVYYSILKVIAWNNINIIDAVSTSNEVTIIFEDKDIDRAFTILKNITK